MSDTPRTDAEIIPMHDGWKLREDVVPSAFARELERELVTVESAIRAEYESKLYVPGQWICQKCGFVQGKSFIGATTGNVWANLEVHNEPCPNDGEQMQRLTWQEYSKSLSQVAIQQVQRAVDAEEQRDALGVSRPYDCYWSRRALEAERKLRELQHRMDSLEH